MPVPCHPHQQLLDDVTTIISHLNQSTLPTKVCLVKAVVFPIVTYACKSWTIKKAEGQRIDAFELWCWRRLMRVPWTGRRSNQSILKEISPGHFISIFSLQFMWSKQPRSETCSSHSLHVTRVELLDFSYLLYLCKPQRQKLIPLHHCGSVHP